MAGLGRKTDSFERTSNSNGYYNEHSTTSPINQHTSSYQSVAHLNSTDEQQSSPLPNSLGNLWHFLVEIRDDLRRMRETLATLALENNLPSPFSEEISIENEHYDDEDNEHYIWYDDDDINMEEEDGDNGGNNDDDEAEVEGNEDAAGNANPGLLAENDAAIEEVNNGVEVEDIFAGLGSQVYQPPLDDTQPSSCSICLEEFEQGRLLGILDCNHRYHYLCLSDWLLVKNSCPLCRVVAI